MGNIRVPPVGVAAGIGAGVAGAVGGAAMGGGANKLWVDSIKREQAEQDRILGIEPEDKGSDFASSVKSFFSFDKVDSGENSSKAKAKASASESHSRHVQEGKEGFICPICKQMYSSAYILEQHFPKCAANPWNG
jgi:hypothetical protein